MKALVVVVVPLVVACGDVAELALLERQAPTIASVATSEGFTEICQACSAELVITGEHLATTDRVAIRNELGDVFAATAIVHASSRRVRALLELPHGLPAGAYDVLASGHQGEAVAPGALAVTPLVVSPSGTAQGRGTFQSPILLCTSRIEAARDFDTVVLLAGTHTCDRVLHLADNIFIFGQGSAVTHVVGTGTGTQLEFTGAGSPSTVFGLTFAGVLAGESIHATTSGLTVFDVRDTGGLRLDDGRGAQISDYHFVGPGPAIVLQVFGSVRIENTTIEGCSEGISIDVLRGAELSALHLQLDTTTISGCGLGMRIGALAPASPVDHQITTFLQHLALVDNARGMLILDGETTMFESTISGGASPIRIEGGSLSLSFSELTGHTGIGFDLDTSLSQGRSTSGISNTLIAGGEIGVRAVGFDRNTFLGLSVTTVRGQTVAAALLDGPNTLLDLGENRHNALSVVSGFALDDRRATVGPFGELMIAVGTTLNGNLYTGQRLQGPLVIGTDIRITSPDAFWQF